MTALIRPSDLKKIEPVMFYEGRNAKVFRRSIAFAIAVGVTSHSSSFEYTISVHAVHAGAVRNVCNIVVSTEKPKPPPIRLKRFSPCTNEHTYPCPTPSPHLLDPTTFSSAFLGRCAIRSCRPAQIYVKCISFIYMYICVST